MDLAGQIADPDPRALQVAENRDRPAERIGEFANDLDRRGMLGVRAVREVDSRDIETRLNELANRLARRARGAEGADDLCTAVRHGPYLVASSRPSAFVLVARPAVSVSKDFWNDATPSASNLSVTSFMLTPAA